MSPIIKYSLVSAATLSILFVIMYSNGNEIKNASYYGISKDKTNHSNSYLAGEMINKRITTPMIIDPAIISQGHIANSDFSKPIEMNIGSEFKSKSRPEEVLVNRPQSEQQRQVTEFDFNQMITLNVISIIGDKLNLEKIKMLTPINHE